jgi:Predicted membrane protein
MNRKNTLFITQAAMIAAIYVALTFIVNLFGLASGAIQIRLSEALCVLPFFTFAAVPGVTIGCLLANILTGSTIYDIIFGTLATLIGAIGSYLLRKHKFLVPIPPIVANTIIIPIVLKWSGLVDDAIPFLMLTVGIGEVISCGLCGLLLIFACEKSGLKIFKNTELMK